MTVSEPLILFTREDCYLCSLAAAMLERAGLAWRPVDIDADPALGDRYGVHIPVIRQPGSGRELFFPFDDDELQRFLSE